MSSTTLRVGLVCLLSAIVVILPPPAAGDINVGFFTVSTLCTSINSALEDPVVLAVEATNFLGANFTCQTTKSVTVQMEANTLSSSKISNLYFNLDTPVSVTMQGLQVGSGSKFIVSGASSLTISGANFDGFNLLSCYLVDTISISDSKFANSGTLGSEVAPIMLNSCSDVEVSRSTFRGNGQGFLAGGVLAASDVTLLSIANSTFSGNSVGPDIGAHVLVAQNSNISITSTQMVYNGRSFDTQRYMINVTGGSFSMANSVVSLNTGSTIRLRQLTERSQVTSSFFNLNFNSNSNPVIEVDGCVMFNVTSSTISYNLGGGIDIKSCAASLASSKVWAQSGYGLQCSADGQISALTASIHKNAWKFNLPEANYADISCTDACQYANVFGNENACANATFQVHGYNVSCPVGRDICSQCSDGQGCLDCNREPFGFATNTTCEKWNTLSAVRSLINYQGTSPDCSLEAMDSSGSIPKESGMDIRYRSLTVLYFNTSSNAEEIYYQLPMNESSYTRSKDSSSGQQCLNYERLLENGAGLLIQQCIFTSNTSIIYGNQTLDVPQDYTKITINLSNMGIFDNETQNYPNLDVRSRRVTLEIDLIMRASGNLQDQMSNLTYLDDLMFHNPNFRVAMQMPNYALFNNNGSTFNYTVQSGGSSNAFRLSMEFKGSFDNVNYDPSYGLLLNSGSGSSDNSILVEVLVPVLVGVALIVVVLFATGFVAWIIWKKKHAFKPSLDAINFPDE